MCLIARLGTVIWGVVHREKKCLIPVINAFIMLESATLRGAGAAFMMFTKKPIVTNKTWKDNKFRGAII